MTLWNELKTSSNAPTNQVILKDAESIDGMFVGVPHAFDALWDGRGYRLATLEDINQGAKISKRAVVNLYVSKTNLVVVFEQAAQFFNEARELQRDYPFESSVFTIRRGRTEKGTRHHAEYARPATQRERTAAATLPRTDLARWVQETFGRTGGTPSAAAPASAPAAGRISAEDAKNITEVFSDLVPEALADFLATFEIKAVSELPATKYGPAAKYALALRSEYPPPPRPAPSYGSSDNNV